MYDGAEDPGRADNLFEPVSGDHGARGRFDARARSFGGQPGASRNRGLIALAAGAVAGLLWGTLSGSRSEGRSLPRGAMRT
jgi:hypothetical protein